MNFDCSHVLLRLRSMLLLVLLVCRNQIVEVLLATLHVYLVHLLLQIVVHSKNFFFENPLHAGYLSILNRSFKKTLMAYHIHTFQLLRFQLPHSLLGDWGWTVGESVGKGPVVVKDLLILFLRKVSWKLNFKILLFFDRSQKPLLIWIHPAFNRGVFVVFILKRFLRHIDRFFLLFNGRLNAAFAITDVV